MKYISYILFLLAGYVGYGGLPLYIVIACALVSSFLQMPARRKQTNQLPDDLPSWADGVYLFTGQFLIMFFAAALGYLIANHVPLG